MDYKKYLDESVRTNPKWRNLILKVSRECNYDKNELASFVEDLLENCNLHDIKNDVVHMIRRG